MTESRIRNITELDKQISACKKQLNLNQSRILAQIAKFKNQSGNFLDPHGKTIETAFNTPESRKNRQQSNAKEEDGEIGEYIRSIKRLQNSLQEKSYILEVQYEKKRLNYQNTIKSLQSGSSSRGSGQYRMIEQKQNTIKILTSQVTQLQKEANEARQQLSHYRKENVKIKEELKQYKADNKIIMNQIDRLSKSMSTPQEKLRIMQERQMRVIKSLYMDAVPIVDERKERINLEEVNDLTNKKRLDEAGENNADLKSLIRRLNEEIGILKAEKASLLEDNKQKTLHLEKQRQIAELSQDSNAKLHDLIQKMGDKILSLEQINQTLRQSLEKLQQQQKYHDSSYFQATRIKAGQFYYKR